MTIERLKQYKEQLGEMQIYRKRLDELQDRVSTRVKDTVHGSSANFPYTVHPVIIQGFDRRLLAYISHEEKRLQERMQRLAAEKEEIEKFIDSLQDSQLRKIIYYRYICGYSWAKTARLIGGNTEDALRKKVSRFFEKK